MISLSSSIRRLEAENAVVRHQLIVLQRRVRGRVHLTNADRLFLVPVSMVSIGAQGDHDRPPRDPRPLASVRLSPVLALEIR
jgi:hypothetical protein